MPQVSVIIAGYNCADSLPRTLASLAAQTVDDWEAIVVDDASTDSTPATIRRLGRAEPRLRAIRLPRNQGSAVARNAAVRLARGRWLAILDADDRWLPDKLSRQLAALEARPDAVWSYHAVRWMRGDELLFEQPPPAPERCLPEIATSDHAVAHSSLMVRRDVFTRLGGYRAHLRRSQDWDLLLRLSADPAVPPPVVLESPLGVYAVRTKHLTSDMVRTAARCQGQAVLDHLARGGWWLRHAGLAARMVDSYLDRLVEWSEVLGDPPIRRLTTTLALLPAPHRRWRWRRLIAAWRAPK